MLHIICRELLNSDPDLEKIIRIRQNDADPTGSATLLRSNMGHIGTPDFSSLSAVSPPPPTDSLDHGSGLRESTKLDVMQVLPTPGRTYRPDQPKSSAAGEKIRPPTES
jgi:hypothetical protein